MFRKVCEELAGITRELRRSQALVRDIAKSLDDPDVYRGLRDRIDALEGPLQAKLGEVEGLLAKAQGYKQAARNAEERARGMESRAEALNLDGEDEAGGNPLPDLEDDHLLVEPPRPGRPVQTNAALLGQLRARKFGTSRRGRP